MAANPSFCGGGRGTPTVLETKKIIWGEGGGVQRRRMRVGNLITNIHLLILEILQCVVLLAKFEVCKEWLRRLDITRVINIHLTFWNVLILRYHEGLGTWIQKWKGQQKVEVLVPTEFNV